MIGATVETTMRPERVAKAADKAAFGSLRHAAAAVRLTARRSIRRSGNPSEPGRPPHTRQGRLREAVLYDVQDDRALIGPRASVVGEAGHAHEFGGPFRDEDYPQRPFMGPALEANLPRFPREFAGSLGAGGDY
jgi:phage gpG-like protein